MDQCPHCEHSLAPEETRCPACQQVLRDRQLDNLRHRDPKVRQHAARHFECGDEDEESIRALAAVLNDSVEDIRHWAGVYLFTAGPKAKCVIPELVAALDHDDMYVRRTAAAALSNIGPEARDALEKLEQLRHTDDDLLRVWVAEAIARIGKCPDD